MVQTTLLIRSPLTQHNGKTATKMVTVTINPETTLIHHLTIQTTMESTTPTMRSPYNPTQWFDTDGDGWGDNPQGYPADAFPNESSQWLDTDGDGHGDNRKRCQRRCVPEAIQRSGKTAMVMDMAMTNQDSLLTLTRTMPAQWFDSDGDGYGDNASGTNPDAIPQRPDPMG